MATQYGEDIPILSYFERNPPRSIYATEPPGFLDVGAGDGLTFSNTEPLLRAGWRGVMIEPAISNLRWLIENHGDNPNVEILPFAVMGESGIRSLWDSREYSTLWPPHREKIEACNAEHVFRKRLVPSLTWGLLGLHNFTFINIDVEGLNLEVLQSAPMHMLNPEMVCIEIDPESAVSEMQVILARAGLPFSKRVGGNLLAARKEIL